MSEWIKCSERLPDQIDWDGSATVNVLIATDAGNVQIGFYETTEEFWCDDLGDMIDTGEEVTHWMPLPENPN